jgi:DNA-binding protein YbaB
MILEINKNVLVEEAVEMLEESLKGRVKSALKSLNPARKSDRKPGRF